MVCSLLSLRMLRTEVECGTVDATISGIATASADVEGLLRNTVAVTVVVTSGLMSS